MKIGQHISALVHTRYNTYCYRPLVAMVDICDHMNVHQCNNIDDLLIIRVFIISFQRR